ncbi:MAG: hypothetical protein AAGG38_01385 [Planctomycetota bacterium]
MKHFASKRSSLWLVLIGAGLFAAGCATQPHSASVGPDTASAHAATVEADAYDTPEKAHVSRKRKVLDRHRVNRPAGFGKRFRH